MPTSVVSLTDRNDPGAFKKGPGTDASMITRMKRQQAIALDIIAHPSGRKGTGAIVDGQHIRGFQDTGVRANFTKHAAALGFFRVL